MDSENLSARSDQKKPRHFDNIERIMTLLETTEWGKKQKFSERQ